MPEITQTWLEQHPDLEFGWSEWKVATFEEDVSAADMATWLQATFPTREGWQLWMAETEHYGFQLNLVFWRRDQNQAVERFATRTKRRRALSQVLDRISVDPYDMH